MLSADAAHANDGWSIGPAVTFIAVILIVGFAIAAAAWTIKRDV
jgi:hypothetical protein